MKDRVLILGISSWIGYLLGENLLSRAIPVSGTTFSTDVIFKKPLATRKISNSDLDGHADMIRNYKPTVIINLLRGEDDNGYNLHRYIIEIAQKSSIHYIYASSVLALDGYENVELLENLDPLSISDYGKFKGKCENLLHKSNISYTILRFSSVQGWVSHKPTRNQLFLTKMSEGESIVVSPGVVQNRILASLLVEFMVELSKDKIRGVVHLGAEDFSEEIDFLQRQAKAFGFRKDLIVPGEPRNVNLVAVPNRIYSLYGDKYRVNEEQTIEGLIKIEGLKNILV